MTTSYENYDARNNKQYLYILHNFYRNICFFASRGLDKSRDKLKPNLYYHNTYGHQTWQSGEI